VPYGLIGIIDENGNRFATWTYDTQGRGLSSQHGTGADLTTVAYDDTTGNRTVTNPLGQQETYKFAMLQNVPKVTEIDRLATTTTAAATRLFTYDANGYAASQTDWNGNLTTYINNIHGEPTTMVEASGTAQARTTTVTYHPAFRLPLSIVTPGLTTTFTYDASGELLTKTLKDTTATIVPYSTNGTSRTWT
jgi:YD repeat-containing protein